MSESNSSISRLKSILESVKTDISTAYQAVADSEMQMQKIELMAAQYLRLEGSLEKLRFDVEHKRRLSAAEHLKLETLQKQIGIFKGEASSLKITHDGLTKSIAHLSARQKRMLQLRFLTGKGRDFFTTRRRGRIFGEVNITAETCDCDVDEYVITAENASTLNQTNCRKTYAAGATITSVTMAVPNDGVVVMMCALNALSAIANFRVQEPLGTNMDTERFSAVWGKTSVCGDTGPRLHLMADCAEYLAGNHTWSLVNVGASTMTVYAHWIKVVFVGTP